jgi:hypothetical protein
MSKHFQKKIEIEREGYLKVFGNPLRHTKPKKCWVVLKKTGMFCCFKEKIEDKVQLLMITAYFDLIIEIFSLIYSLFLCFLKTELHLSSRYHSYLSTWSQFFHQRQRRNSS